MSGEASPLSIAAQPPGWMWFSLSRLGTTADEIAAFSAGTLPPGRTAELVFRRDEAMRELIEVPPPDVAQYMPAKAWMH